MRTQGSQEIYFFTAWFMHLIILKLILFYAKPNLQQIYTFPAQ